MPLQECPHCRQFFSAKRMGRHIRFDHFEEWLRKQPPKEVPPKPRVHQLPPGVVIRPPPKLKGVRLPRLSLSAVTHQVASSQRDTRSDPRAVPKNRPALAGSLQAALTKAVPMKANPASASVAARPSTVQPALTRKARRQANTYGLQLSRVPEKNNPQGFSASVSTLVAQPLAPRRTIQQPTPLTRIEIQCSCGGENSRCFRCDGRGYYEGPTNGRGGESTQHEVRVVTGSGFIATYAADSRGADRTVREKGRFPSLPSYDDYGDESSS